MQNRIFFKKKSEFNFFKLQMYDEFIFKQAFLIGQTSPKSAFKIDILLSQCFKLKIIL